MHVDLTYFSASCNRTPNICDWGRNNLLCYGSCNSVIICDPKYPGTNKNVKILISHLKRVNAVRWIRQNNCSPETELISGSSDGTAIIWSLNDDNYNHFILTGHKDGVNNIEGFYDKDGKDSLIVATASTDSSVKIWRRDKYGGEVTCTQTINFDRGFAFSLGFTILPGTNNALLACGRDTTRIELYVLYKENPEENEQFKLIESLAGHENWVRGLDFTTDDNGSVYLTSCAQDNYIRIWCIKPQTENEVDMTIEEIFTQQSLKAMNRHFSIKHCSDTKHFTVHLVSVLCGHEGWVYEVRWFPKQRLDDGTLTNSLTLLSSSLDKTLLIWTFDETTGLWMDSVRVGIVGGNTLGFHGCKFSPDGNSILGHGYAGSFHLWNFNQELNCWEPGVTFGGHTSGVSDLAWEPNGEFLISVSLDQTTRIHAPWVRDKMISWHELARPQVHGYDISCLAILSRYNFVSGAEEKIVRAFKAPSNFVTNFRRICNIENDPDGDEIMNVSGEIPKGASVPSLGLSNKAVYGSNNKNETESDGREEYPEDSYFHEVQLKAPPTEEDLLQNTLWPEVQKLYGHGYEVFALAASHDGKIIASACKAATTKHATIILWDTKIWKQLQKLESHNLTITQISFSPDDIKILSVSRDRRITIFEKDPTTNEFKLTATTEKKNGIHSRIVWCCSWSHDSKYCVTGSRDGKLVVWWKNILKKPVDTLCYYESVGIPLELKNESITAVDFAPVPLNDENYLICFGLETGKIFFYKWNLKINWTKLHEIVAHHLIVKRICFRPKRGVTGNQKSNENILQVATCSTDYSVKIFNVNLI